jgi:hypothetical protein
MATEVSAWVIESYIDAEDCNRPAIGLQHTKAASRTADLLPVVDAIRADGITSAL